MNLFPVILGGHDHDMSNETHGPNNCRLIKPGMDAKDAAIIDLVWWSADKNAVPTVEVTFKPVLDFKPCPTLADMVDKAYKPVRELESATLYVLEKGAKLTSVDSRFKDVSMAS